MARTVLVVDDSPPFRVTARGLLEARGYDVVGVAEDGAGGLAAARSLRPDAVLLDIDLPDVDGITVAGWLASEAPRAAVVLVSSLDEPGSGDAIAASGARGFVAKADLGSARLVELLGPPERG